MILIIAISGLVSTEKQSEMQQRLDGNSDPNSNTLPVSASPIKSVVMVFSIVNIFSPVFSQLR